MANKNQNQDHPLKLLTKILFDSIGCSSYFEVMLRNKSYISQYKTHDVSDIDVLGFHIMEDLTIYKIGAECKSGENEALEELFKFSGIMRHFELSKGYLIKSKIHQNAREISVDQNIQCFTEAEIRKILLGFNVHIDKQYSIENAKYLSIQEALSVGKSQNEKLYNYLLLDYWNKENWKNIHNIIHLLSEPKDKTLFEKENIKMVQFYYYVLQLFSLSTIINISKAIQLSYSDIERSIEISLYGKAEEYHEKRKIHDAVNIATKSKDSFEPLWQSDYINICTRFSQRTQDTSKVVRLFQDVSGSSFFKDRIIINKGILKKYSDVTLKFAKDICQFISKYTALTENIYADFMNL